MRPVGLLQKGKRALMKMKRGLSRPRPSTRAHCYSRLVAIGFWILTTRAFSAVASQAAIAQDASDISVQNLPASTDGLTAGNDQSLTLQEAVERALTNYPTVRIALERVLAARAQVGLARTQFLPQANILWQTNRSTYNNLPGLLMPQSVVPPITGPVLADTSNTSVWGSAGALLMNWEPTRFGYRKAEVAAAQARSNAAADRLALTKLDVATAAASAYLTVMGAHEQVASAQADLSRRQTFANSIHVLVKNQLRPGADASEADAELAASRTRLIQAQTLEKVDLAALAELLGLPSGQISLAADPLLDAPKNPELPAFAVATHPAAVEQNHLFGQTQEQTRVLSRAYLPRFYLEGTVSGRGSGVKPDGTLLEGTNGLGPDRDNWAVGIQATFAPFDYFSIRDQKKIAASNERAQQLNYQNTLASLSTEEEQARAQLNGALQVARNTPVQLEAARMGESQARARYQAALANIVEATQAQALLEQAEAQDALARVGVWQALLGVFAAQGDLNPFLSLLPKQGSGGH
jgi:outer membrane protein